MTKPLRIEADWNTWADIPTTTLQEAVFLSLDLEPIGASDKFNRWLFRACAHVDKTEPLRALREFNRRIIIVRAHIEELAKFPGAYHRDIQNAKVSLSKFGTWAENIGFSLPDKFPRQTASDQPIDATAREADASTLVGIKNEPAPTQNAAPAPVEAVGASGGVEPDKAGPLPLTTGDIAFCFADLRWSEQQWKKPLGNKPKWLVACIAIPGLRGVSETRWNPVLIGAALVRDRRAKPNRVRARFQTVQLLQPWRETWKTYETDNFDIE